MFRKSFLAAFVVVMGLLFAGNALAAYHPVLPNGLDQSNPRHAWDQFQGAVSQDPALGLRLASNTGQSSYTAVNYRVVGYGKASTNSTNTALDDHGNNVPATNSRHCHVGAKVLIVVNVQTNAEAEICTGCANPRIARIIRNLPKKAWAVDTVRRFHQFVAKKFSKTCRPSGQEVHGTLTAWVDGVVHATANGQIQGKLTAAINAQVSEKIGAQVAVECGLAPPPRIKVVIKPAPKCTQCLPKPPPPPMHKATRPKIVVHAKVDVCSNKAGVQSTRPKGTIIVLAGNKQKCVKPAPLPVQVKPPTLKCGGTWHTVNGQLVCLVQSQTASNSASAATSQGAQTSGDGSPATQVNVTVQPQVNVQQENSQNANVSPAITNQQSQAQAQAPAPAPPTTTTTTTTTPQVCPSGQQGTFPNCCPVPQTFTAGVGCVSPKSDTNSGAKATPTNASGQPTAPAISGTTADAQAGTTGSTKAVTSTGLPADPT